MFAYSARQAATSPSVISNLPKSSGIVLHLTVTVWFSAQGEPGLWVRLARGAYSAGGKIIGVIPEKLNIPGIYFEHCTERIQTATMHERKQLMESRSDAFVALSGGFGTLEELLEVLTLKQLGYHNLPVIIVNINGFYDPLIASIRALALAECLSISIS